MKKIIIAMICAIGAAAAGTAAYRKIRGECENGKVEVS